MESISGTSDSYLRRRVAPTHAGLENRFPRPIVYRVPTKTRFTVPPNAISLDESQNHLQKRRAPEVECETDIDGLLNGAARKAERGDGRSRQELASLEKFLGLILRFDGQRHYAKIENDDSSGAKEAREHTICYYLSNYSLYQW